MRLGAMNATSVGPVSGSLAIVGSARAILGPRGRAVKRTDRSVTHADEWPRPVQERPEGGKVERQITQSGTGSPSQA
jgi:hypothetical protein